jgi:di/tripeptidase
MKSTLLEIEVKMVLTAFHRGSKENKRTTQVVSTQASRKQLNKAREALNHVFQHYAYDVNQMMEMMQDNLGEMIRSNNKLRNYLDTGWRQMVDCSRRREYVLVGIWLDYCVRFRFFH